MRFGVSYYIGDVDHCIPIFPGLVSLIMEKLIWQLMLFYFGI